MGDGLGCFVLCRLDDLQVFSGNADALMVTAVEQHMGAEEGMEERAGQIIGWMEGVFSRMPVQGFIGHFPDRAAQIEVDQLHAFADAKDGLFHLKKQIECLELF